MNVEDFKERVREMFPVQCAGIEVDFRCDDELGYETFLVSGCKNLSDAQRAAILGMWPYPGDDVCFIGDRPGLA